jgi:hypothetical protein
MRSLAERTLLGGAGVMLFDVSFRTKSHCPDGQAGMLEKVMVPLLVEQIAGLGDPVAGSTQMLDQALQLKPGSVLVTVPLEELASVMVLLRGILGA